MKLLFVQGGSRWKLDTDGNLYTDGNFDNNIWRRYRSLCDEMTVILRREARVYSPGEAAGRFNAFDRSLATPIMLTDVYSPAKNYFNPAIQREIRRVIEREVKAADRVIIRSVGTFYTDTALHFARKYEKRHLVEVTGYSWEALWYHSLKGKLTAPFNELRCKRLLRNVPCAVYVTNEALQKRYPNRGESLGCSDVELQAFDEAVLTRRLKRIAAQSDDERLVIGTAAFLDVGWKGQEYVIRAIAKLREKGIDRFEYQLIGGGTGERLKGIAESLGVADRVRVIGTLPHDQVFAWMDALDLYVQSSFMEGLCRSLVEAMSRACPVVASNVGGNYELVSPECLFPKGNAEALSGVLERMLSPEARAREARRGFEHSKEFDKALLDKKRDDFYRKFING